MTSGGHEFNEGEGEDEYYDEEAEEYDEAGVNVEVENLEQ